MFFSMQIFHTWEENADSLTLKIAFIFFFNGIKQSPQSHLTSCEIPRGDLEAYSVAVELKVKSFRKDADGDTIF